MYISKKTSFYTGVPWNSWIWITSKQNPTHVTVFMFCTLSKLINPTKRFLVKSLLHLSFSSARTHSELSGKGKKDRELSSILEKFIHLTQSRKIIFLYQRGGISCVFHTCSQKEDRSALQPWQSGGWGNRTI